MIEETRLQGRPFGPAELTQVRALLSAHPDWSRRRLSRQLAQGWDWRNPAGQLKDMAARTLLLKLHQRGWIELPARRQRPAPRRRPTALPTAPSEAALEVPITEPLAALLPLSFHEVSTSPSAGDRALFTTWLARYHYLSYRCIGENLQYVVRDRQGRGLACLLLGAAAWQCRARDQHLGWDAATRQRRLGLITNNTRFLVLPWVRVPQLASHLLSGMTRSLSADWQRKYGHPLALVETFVDPSRFTGRCYQAANWLYVGATTGRTRQNKTWMAAAPPKAVWLCPLSPDYRALLCAP